jgi:Sec-independent protein translocase protein TatA
MANMANFTIVGRGEQADETSFTNKTTGEVDTRLQLTLNVPGMSDRVLCEMALDVAPKAEVLERWELEETWLVISANSMRALGFARSNARPGERAVGALVIFQATDVREATADERRALMEARKVSKLQAKQRRAQRKAERDAANAREAQQAQQMQAAPAIEQQSA